MSKVKIRVSIQTEQEEQTYETTALFSDNILKYKEKDNTTVILNIENNELIRENQELKMHYYLDLNRETEGIILIKEFQKEILIKIKTQKIKRKKNDIEFVFQTEENHHKYHIEVLI